MMKPTYVFRAVASAALGAALSAGSANATLIINATGTGLGFSATTVVSAIPATAPNGFGPFGLTLTGDNNILFSNFANNTRYVIPDANGQTFPSAALFTVPASGSSTQGYAKVGGLAYGSNGSNYVQFNNDGTVNHVLTFTGLPSVSPSLGMAGNPVSGKLIAASSRGLIEIDPIANTYRVINSVSGDGVSVSPNGTIAYVEVAGAIRGYNIATGTQVFQSNAISGGPDGTGVIASTSALNGFIIVVKNNGDVSILDPITKTETLIGTNANERGDYVSPDFTNGTLLIDFSTQIVRLSCGELCAIGTVIPEPPPIGGTVPEPATLALVGIAIAGVGWTRRKQTSTKS
jgi:hypothetical protein